MTTQIGYERASYLLSTYLAFIAYIQQKVFLNMVYLPPTMTKLADNIQPHSIYNSGYTQVIYIDYVTELNNLAFDINILVVTSISSF